MTSRLRRKHQTTVWRRLSENLHNHGRSSGRRLRNKQTWSNIASTTAIALAVLYQAVGVTPLSAAEHSVLVRKNQSANGSTRTKQRGVQAKATIKPSQQPVTPVVAWQSAVDPNRSAPTKLKWRKRQPTGQVTDAEVTDAKETVTRSAIVTASGKRSPHVASPAATIPSRISAPRILPAADLTPIRPVAGPHLHLVQDAGSDVNPDVDDLFNDAPVDGRSEKEPKPFDLPLDNVPEVDPDPRESRQPNLNNTPRLTPQEQAQKCREDAQIRDAEINGTDKQVGAIKYCENARIQITDARHHVANLSVDISPPLPTGGFHCDRDWRDITGRFIFRGRPSSYDVIAGSVTIKSTDGRLHKLQFDELGLEDRKQFLAMYRLPMDCALTDLAKPFQPRDWTPSTFSWTASSLCSKPLYFEQIHAERYGHSPGPILGPIVSSAHFFATIPVLPYKMGLTPPNECIYTLGYYRPGNCAPYLLDPIPISIRAGLFQAGAVVGGVFLIP